MILDGSIGISTRGNADIVDITPYVKDFIKNNNIVKGAVTLFVPGSTGALTTIEYESGALADLKRFLDRIIPPDEDYQHNYRWGDGNGHSHLRAALLGPSLSIPVIESELTLGTWQQIIFIDCDNRPRKREIIIQVYCE